LSAVLAAKVSTLFTFSTAKPYAIISEIHGKMFPPA
jgi:hypothetical protein